MCDKKSKPKEFNRFTFDSKSYIFNSSHISVAHNFNFIDKIDIKHISTKNTGKINKICQILEENLAGNWQQKSKCLVNTL